MLEMKFIHLVSALDKRLQGKQITMDEADLLLDATLGGAWNIAFPNAEVAAGYRAKMINAFETAAQGLRKAGG